MFKFFFEIVRKDFINFCGSRVDDLFKITLDTEGDDAKVAFKKYENGEFKLDAVIKTRHPNLLLMLIIGKKSWGLWKEQYSEGIANGDFTKFEILEEFHSREIVIPDPYLIELNNRIWFYREKIDFHLKKMDSDFKVKNYTNF